MNYNELKIAVKNYFHRGDIEARIPTCIQLAEAFLFRELSVVPIQKKASGTTTDGLIALPDDWKSTARLSAFAYGVEYVLDYGRVGDDATDQGGIPNSYVAEGSNLRIFPNAGTGTEYTLYYTPRLAALSESNPTNWLLENAFDLYFYASALHVASDIRDGNEAAKLEPVVYRLLESARRMSETHGIPSMGKLQIKARR